MQHQRSITARTTQETLQENLHFLASWISREHLIKLCVAKGAGREEAEIAATLIELRDEQLRKNYKHGWLAHRFRERIGRWPPADWRERIDTIVELLS
jgi:hypothetical protein